jgi:hypothetical protein
MVMAGAVHRAFTGVSPNLYLAHKCSVLYFAQRAGPGKRECSVVRGQEV